MIVQGQRISFDSNQDLIENVTQGFLFLHWNGSTDEITVEPPVRIDEMEVPLYYEEAGGMPKDAATITTFYVVLDGRMQKAIMGVAAFVALLGIGCLSLTLYHRNKKLVFLVSPISCRFFDRASR